MNKRHKRYLVWGAACFLVCGCASTKVERVDRGEKIDLSGKWNDYDAKLVAEEMVEDSLSGRWLARFQENEGRPPVVIVGHVSNRSDEHINTNVFTEFLERELMNSGDVIFVASPEEREGLRAEREDQQKGFTDPATVAEVGREKGADLMLIGSVNSVKDQVKGKSVNFYQVNLELVNLETNEKVWIGRKELKKFVKVRKFTF